MKILYALLLVANIVCMGLGYKDKDWFAFSLNCLGAIICFVRLMD